MDNMWDILKGKTDSLDTYYKIIEQCEARRGELYGIPSVIGLADIREEGGEAVYACAPSDEELKYVMAVGAMIYTKIFSEKSQEELGEYPPIAPAISTMAAAFFQLNEEGMPESYFDLVKEE